MIDVDGWDLAAMAAAWRAALPFPHLVIDELVDRDALDALVAALDDEPAAPIADQIFAFLATGRELEHPALQGFAVALAAPAVTAALRAITGEQVATVEVRGYAYHPGHYLLPHTDDRAGLDRRLAFAFYLPSPAPPSGGELDLFAVTRDDAGETVATAIGATIDPRPGRLALFAVGDDSLHQVREVTDGIRLSLAGWFHP